MEKLIKFFKDEEGASAVEYGILIALIAAAVITVITALGTKINSAFDKVEKAIHT